MPVSVVVGGQFGSEGKGKVALHIVRTDPTVAAAVRVGGTNSGHTGVDRNGNLCALRQLPAAAIDRSIMVILPPGSYIDVAILKREVDDLGLTKNQIAISPLARVITEEHKQWETTSALDQSIGSTQSGTGGAVLAMIARGAPGFPARSVGASEIDDLAPYLRDTTQLMRNLLDAGRRIVIEGTQGFGLSILHGRHWPKATSRDTTASGFVAEAGLSPRDVDDVTMVIRCHPIRVAGNSGPLPYETSWEDIAAKSGLPSDYRERTTVTGKVRRVARFDPDVVLQAIAANAPDRLVLNHLDYVDPKVRSGSLTDSAQRFVQHVENAIRRHIDLLGISPATLIARQTTQSAAA